MIAVPEGTVMSPWRSPSTSDELMPLTVSALLNRIHRVGCDRGRSSRSSPSSRDQLLIMRR